MTQHDVTTAILSKRFDKEPKTNAVFHLIDHHLELGNEDVYCLIDSSQVLTFGDFHVAINHYSAILKQNGVDQKDKVLILLEPGTLFQQVLLAIVRLGAIAVVCDHEKHTVTAVSEKEQVKIIVTHYKLRAFIDVNQLPALQQVLLTEHVNQLPQTTDTIDVSWVEASQPVVKIYHKDEILCYRHGHVTLLADIAETYLIQTEETILVPAFTYTHPLFYWLAWVKCAGVYLGPVEAKTVEQLKGFVALMDEDVFNHSVKADCELEVLGFDQQQLTDALNACGHD
jgi:acyl-CoA synthetase (AMP-forming)/AMP-acid ligase II